MRSRLYRHLQVSCVGFIGIAIGVLVGSHAMTVPSVVHPLVHRSGDAEEALNTVIPEIDLEGTPFNDAVEKVRKVSPVPIVVHWQMLAAAGLDARAPVIFRARDVTLGRIVSELVKALNLATASAVYVPANDLILISAHQDTAPLEVAVRSYDVGDLLRPPADPWNPRHLPEPITEDGMLLRQPLPMKEDLERIVQEAVAADSWREAGGQIGSIHTFSGRMIVTQTWENHRQLAELLAELREPPPKPMPPPPTPDLKLWNDTLKKYVSTNESIGEAALRRRFPEVRLDGVPLQQAVTMLADQAHADLIVDWGAFGQANVNIQTPVSAHLNDVTLTEALHGLLHAAGAGPLDFRIDGGFVVLGPSNDDHYAAVTRVYDIGDWLAAVMGPPPTPAPQSPADLATWCAERNSHIDKLIRVVEDTIVPASWKETGGNTGTIKELNGELIVTQTWENQERVADLLAAVRTDPSRLRVPARVAPATLP